MNRDTHVRSAGWTIGLRVWLERAGRAVLGPGRLELLEGICREHSISAAARQMGMSYRRAWLLVQSINQAAGQAVIEATTGGIQGGGARLTSHGEQLVAVFKELQERLQNTAAASLPELRAPARPEAAVHVAAAISLEEVVGRLLSDFARQTPSVPVRVVYGASDALADQVLEGVSSDLLLTADERQLDRLAVGATERVVLAANRLVALGPVDQSVPVRRPADLLRPEVTRIACAKPGSPLGDYTVQYLERLGLYDKLKARLLALDNAGMVACAVRAGQADAGFVYGSDAASPGCQVLFRVPRAAVPIRYLAGLLRGARQPVLARQLFDFLTSPLAAQRFRQCGFFRVSHRWHQARPR
jgi:molybdenum ABC transporter molybdate-binding protein